MVDPSDHASAVSPPPGGAGFGSERPPGVVLAAAVVTCVSASITAAFALLIGVLVLLAFGPVFDVFQGQHLQWYVLAATLVVIALSAAALAVIVLLFLSPARAWFGPSRS
jgi:hypothetical protein